MIWRNTRSHLELLHEAVKLAFAILQLNLQSLFLGRIILDLQILLNFLHSSFQCFFGFDLVGRQAKLQKCRKSPQII